ncbi:MAG: SLC13 family permease [Bacteroidales bacterium]|nr:SLC13 family permease [Bacteroidales bacterium]
MNTKKIIGLLVTFVITVFLWAVPTSFFGIDALTVVQQRVIAMFVMAALLWIFEPIPNWTTSVLVIVMSLLTVSNKGIGYFCTPEAGELVVYTKIMSSFADPVVMLFLGGFVLAIMASKYGLDVTLARLLLKPFGKKPKMVLLGFLIVIAIFSMFMSNTATSAMMLAFLAPVLAVLPSDDKGKIGLSLAIPVAANLGGIGTPIGTPPNATAVKFLAEAGLDVSFSEWALRMIPFVAILIIIAWVLLQVLFPFKSKEIVLDIKESDRKADWKTYVVWATFIGTILLWATEKLTGINSNVVALIPLAVLTCTGIFTSEDIKEINWTVLWLVAGGFALGTDLQGTGLAKVLIDAIPFGEMGVIAVFIIAGVVCYFLSNFISNSATAALLIPILIVIAEAMGQPDAASHDTFVALGGTQAMISFIAVCASIAMLFPISTPPNAIAASTGLVETKDMAKIGLIIGAIAFVLGYFWLTKVFPFEHAQQAVEAVATI